MTILKSFSTFIMHHRLYQSRSRILKELLEDCYKIRDYDAEGQVWSKKHYPFGYTSFQNFSDLHRMNSTFEQFERELRPHVARFARSCGYSPKANQLEMTDCWLNIMEEGCCHTGHIHPHSIISGTLYLATPKGAPGIRFEDPRLSSFMLAPLRKRISRDTQPFIDISPNAGEFVLFESWLRHEVPTHQAEQPRVSVSFNYVWEES